MIFPIWYSPHWTLFQKNINVTDKNLFSTCFFNRVMSDTYISQESYSLLQQIF